MDVRTTGSQSAGSMPKEETSNTWIKLKGPAAESLSKAFFGPAVVVLQDNKGARRVAEAAEEDTAIVPIAPVREAEGGGAVITGRGGTTVSVSPARIVIAGTSGAGKSIKVLKTYRIVLLGRTGAGKSSLANTIFGEDVFKIKHSSTCGTRECQAESKSVHGRRITLVDTPDFFDTDRPEEKLKCEIVRSITECTPGPHAFFIVLKVGTFTKYDEAVVTKMFHYFSEEALKYVAVVFTHGDLLPEGVKIEEFVNQSKCLSDLVKKCGGRCHVVDNKYWKNNQRDEYRSNWFQVTELLNTTDKILMENKGGCYTNEMLKAVSRVIQEKSNRTALGNMSQGHTSSKADNSVSKNVWIKLTGPAAESLGKALLHTTVIDLRGTGGENRGGEVKEEGEEETETEDEAKEAATETEDKAEEAATETEDEAEEAATGTEDEAEEAENEEVATEPEAATDKDAEEVTERKTAKHGQQAGGGGFLGSLFGSFFGIVAALGGVTAAVVGGAAAAAWGAAVAAMVGAAGVGIGAWVKSKLKGILKDLQQHSRIILLVAVFYLMLLLSFWEQVRMFGVILLCLSLVLLLLLS
ncbi:uncharacterized protein LOC126404504 isoform X2 [Epinephelus moara]|uniref:uncharacterized protein LOC126404504 isoform X2 n=1 Tax=Epinephelus moara TaxID=300413 RepID=UPI00214E9A6D|nr:uncharacterized protein LOC126404504 isoform X2 [Epinephelus moara]